MKELVQSPRRRCRLRRVVSNLTPRLRLKPLRFAAAGVLAVAFMGIAPCISQASPITYYASRNAFNHAHPGLPVEGFSAAKFIRNCSPGSVYCYGFQRSPLNRVTNYAPFFSANSILPGMTVTTLLPETSGNQNLILFNNGALNTNGTKSVGSNNFGDTLAGVYKI